jgi:hypothetical protein
LGGAAQLLSLGGIMRIIFSIVAILGLFLTGFSMFEYQATNVYRSKVGEVQDALRTVDTLNVNKAKMAGATFTGTSFADQYGSLLDGIGALQRSWLVATFASAVVFLSGAAGVIIARRPYV